MRVAIVHDYLTQRGGAERVVLSMAKAFPGAPIHTSVYDPGGTFPEFRDLDVRPSLLQRVPGLANRHRLGLPLYAPVFSRMKVDADVLVCSSSGWAHGVRTPAGGRKVVYCYNPARWLYQVDEYAGSDRRGWRLVAGAAQWPLRRWDRAAASTADRYLTSSRIVADRIRKTYGIEAQIVPPPPAVMPGGATAAVPGIEPGFLLCVARLLPYKNVDAVVGAFRRLPHRRLVVVGDGPARAEVGASLPPNVVLLASVGDEQLRWLYENAAGAVAAAWEDYGLTPLEAASIGKPSAVLRWGGYLDTMTDETAEFFDTPEPEQIADAVGRLAEKNWDEEAIERHARTFAEPTFLERLRSIVHEAAEADPVVPTHA